MTNQAVQIKKTSMEPPEFRGLRGEVVRETGHGYIVVKVDDGREVILHPDSIISVQ